MQLAQAERKVPPKRTRVNVKQSKNGCYTCRSRRLKCDETKPSCLRCKRAGTKCDGYPSDSRKAAFENDSPNSGPTSVTSTGSETSLQPYLGTERLFNLGFGVLDNKNDEGMSRASTIVWTILLPKLCIPGSSIYFATAALGAAYEASTSSVNLHGRSNLTSSFPYETALAALQTSLQTRIEHPVTQILSSLLLAGVEALQRDLANALTHIRGAFELYADYANTAGVTDSRPHPYRLTMEERIALKTLMLEFDMQITTYKRSIGSQLPPSALQEDKQIQPVSSMQAEYELMRTLHDAYAFADSATSHKYIHCSKVPSTILEQQTAHLSLLQGQLSRLETRQDASLRLRYLAAIVYVASCLSPFETIFDSLHEHFQQIINIATLALYDGPHPRPTFRLMVFLSQPLFTTAVKCRDPGLRRTATELLHQASREGPWNSELLVPIVQKAMEIEEQYLNNQQSILEKACLHGFGMGIITSDSGSPVDGIIPKDSNGGQGHRVIKVCFKRCIDVEAFITANEKKYEEMGEDNDRFWEVWNERIELRH